MPTRNRSNPLALAVLITLLERPMHPYEVATTLRLRGNHESVRLNYGSLYAVMDSLVRRRLVEAAATQKEGRLPERTVYRLTSAGAVEAQDWLADLLSAPTREYPAFTAALSFLPAMHPDQAVQYLEERLGHLELEKAQKGAFRDVAQEHNLPRVLWVEAEYEAALREAEIEFVRQLVRDIRSGALDGVQWWRDIHEKGVTGPPPGFIWPGRSLNAKGEAGTDDGPSTAPKEGQP